MPAPAPLALADAVGIATAESGLLAIASAADVVAEAPHVEGSSGFDGPDPNAPPARLVSPAGLIPRIAAGPGKPTGMAEVCCPVPAPAPVIPVRSCPSDCGADDNICGAEDSSCWGPML